MRSALLANILFTKYFPPRISMVLEEEEEDAQPITRKSEIRILDTRGQRRAVLVTVT